MKLELSAIFLGAAFVAICLMLVALGQRIFEVKRIVNKMELRLGGAYDKLLTIEMILVARETNLSGTLPLTRP